MNQNKDAWGERVKRAAAFLPLFALAFFSFAAEARADYTAEYWNVFQSASPEMPDGEPDFSETIPGDGAVDLNWGGQSPDPSVNTEGFVARFTQTINFAPGEYTFAAAGDDGVRVYVDDELVINGWFDQSAEYLYLSPLLTLSGSHDIRYEYYENATDARVRFWYEAGAPVTGSGTTSDDPVLIHTCTGLQALLGTTTQSRFFELANDIDCAETSEWFVGAVSGYQGFAPASTFRGSLDGQGHEITDLYINRGAGYLVGLFSDLENAFIGDLRLLNPSVVGGMYAGTLAGYATDGTLLAGVTVAGASVAAQQLGGGLIGELAGGEIRRSSYQGNVTTDLVPSYVGGLIGRARYETSIFDSYSRGAVAGGYAGGLVGLFDQSSCVPVEYERSYSTASVTGSYVGGLFGGVNDVSCGALNIVSTFAASGDLEGDVRGGLVGSVVNSALSLYATHFEITPTSMVFGLDESSTNTDNVFSWSAGLDPDYLKGNQADEPIDEWDFESVWLVQDGDFPALNQVFSFGAPGLPQDIEAEGSGLEYSLDWNSPSDFSDLPIQEYEYQVRLSGQSWASREEGGRVESTNSEGAFTLRPNQTYDVRVRALNAYGWGEWAEALGLIETAEVAVNLVSTCEDLLAIDDATENGAAFYRLTNDIDCSGVAFSPIGYGDGSEFVFSGELDGDGYSISGLSFETDLCEEVGLFSYIDGALIKDLTLVSPNFLGICSVGALSGFAEDATISNVRVLDATLNGSDTSTGGLFGAADADHSFFSISDSFVSGTVTTTGDSGGLIGDFDPKLSSTISRTAAEVTIVNPDGGNMGGLIGELDIDSEEDGETVTLTIEDSYFNGSLSSEEAGGLIGDASIEADYDEDSPSRLVIERSYSAGSGDGSYIGGIIGYVEHLDDGEYLTVDDSFSAMSLAAEGNYPLVANIEGYDDIDNISVNFFYDQDLAGVDSCTNQEDVETCVAIEGDPTYFIDEEENDPLGEWDFEAVWYSAAESFPLLREVTVDQEEREAAPEPEERRRRPTGRRSRGESTTRSSAATPEPQATVGQVSSGRLSARELQRFLNARGFTVAVSGPGSAGQETDTFGEKTREALARFQAANGISPAAGVYGPVTEAAIAALLGGGEAPVAPAAAPAVSGTFSRDLELGAEGEDVRALQAILVERASGPAAAALAANGASGYFGELTRAALVELQASLGITPATGYFGPRTRAALGL